MGQTYLEEFSDATDVALFCGKGRLEPQYNGILSFFLRNKTCTKSEYICVVVLARKFNNVFITAIVDRRTHTRDTIAHHSFTFATPANGNTHCLSVLCNGLSQRRDGVGIIVAWIKA